MLRTDVSDRVPFDAEAFISAKRNTSATERSVAEVLRFALMNASASKGTRSETSVRSTHHPQGPTDGEGTRNGEESNLQDTEFAVERTRTEDLLMRSILMRNRATAPLRDVP